MCDLLCTVLVIYLFIKLISVCYHMKYILQLPVKIYCLCKGMFCLSLPFFALAINKKMYILCTVLFISI